MRRGRRKESRLETGTSGVGAGRTCPVSPRISIPRCEAGSIITGASTAQSCIPLQSVSTGTSFDGRCTSSNDCGTGPTGRGPGYTVSVGESLGCSLTGTSSHAPPAGLWGPDDERSSRPVLRAAGGVIPPADSTRAQAPRCAGCAGGRYRAEEGELGTRRGYPRLLHQARSGLADEVHRAPDRGQEGPAAD